MGMSTKYTTATQLQKAIDENLVTIVSTKIEYKDSDHETKTITADQFKNDLDFYMESGIFADTLDFKYELQDTTLTVDIGYMSCYCDKCITVNLSVNDGVSNDDLEKGIKKVDIEELKETIREIDKGLDYRSEDSPEYQKKFNELTEILEKEKAKMDNQK